jgi:UDP-N-acetylmuramate--alanine ligase
MFWSHKKKQKIHLVGIGGSGMSGIAEVLLASGFKVSGSDLNLSPTTERLEKLGAKVCQGHDAGNIADATCVVLSSAVKQDNPEWLEANKKSIPVIQRAEMLAELMRLKKGVAVAGSHGKTTTTSILGQILKSLDPTVVVGGKLQHWNASSIVGSGEVFVIEADESDRSFLKFSPVHSIVTNIDLEHMETYESLEDIEDTFVKFLNRTAFFGQNWINSDCESLLKIRSKLKKPTKTYGFSENSDLRILNLEFKHRQSYFELKFNGKDLGQFESSLLGRHNILNLTAAIGTAISLGLTTAEIKMACKKLLLAERRLQIHMENEELAVIEDYGHHPTEIEATLSALDLMFPERKKIIYFQPHRYSRTKALWNDFAPSFKKACDKLYLLPIYAAHESEIEGVSSEKLAETFRDLSVETLSEVPDALTIKDKLPKEPSIVLILGASPLTQLAKNLAQVCDPNKSAKRQSL